MRLLTITMKCAAALALVSVGTVLLVLPGPGFPLILAGVTVLATEFTWAASLQRRMVELVRALLRAGADVIARLREKSQPAPCTGTGCD